MSNYEENKRIVGSFLFAKLAELAPEMANKTEEEIAAILERELPGLEKTARGLIKQICVEPEKN